MRWEGEMEGKRIDDDDNDDDNDDDDDGDDHDDDDDDDDDKTRITQRNEYSMTAIPA